MADDCEDERGSLATKVRRAKRGLYSGQLNVVADLDSSDAVGARFVDRRYFTRGGATFRLVRDHLGSVRLVVDASTGTVAQRLDCNSKARCSP